MKDIGIKIKEHRVKNNLSQEELAKAINVTRQAVSKWERSESLPDIENIILLSDLFKISMDEIIGRKKDKLKNKDINFGLYALALQVLGLTIFMIVSILVFSNNMKVYFLGEHQLLSEMSSTNVFSLVSLFTIILLLVLTGLVFIILFNKSIKDDNQKNTTKFLVVVLLLSQISGLLLILSYNDQKKSNTNEVDLK